MIERVVDCAEVTDREDFWNRYLEIVDPGNAHGFGRNLDALADAILAGGPGWPGPGVLTFINTAGLAWIEHGRLLQALQALVGRHGDLEVFVERPSA